MLFEHQGFICKGHLECIFAAMKLWKEYDLLLDPTALSGCDKWTLL